MSESRTTSISVEKRKSHKSSKRKKKRRRLRSTSAEDTDANEGADDNNPNVSSTSSRLSARLGTRVQPTPVEGEDAEPMDVSVAGSLETTTELHQVSVTTISRDIIMGDCFTKSSLFFPQVLDLLPPDTRSDCSDLLRRQVCFKLLEFGQCTRGRGGGACGQQHPPRPHPDDVFKFFQVVNNTIPASLPRVFQVSWFSYVLV